MTRKDAGRLASSILDALEGHDAPEARIITRALAGRLAHYTEGRCTLQTLGRTLARLYRQALYLDAQEAGEVG